MTGVYETWPDCEAQVKGHPGARYKKFTKLTEAKMFVAAMGGPRRAFIDGNSDSSVGASGSSSISGGLTTRNVRPAVRSVGAGGISLTTSVAAPIQSLSIQRRNGNTITVYTDGACSSNGRKYAKVSNFLLCCEISTLVARILGWIWCLVGRWT